MQAESAVRGTVASQTSQDAHPVVLAAATAALIWYIAVVLVGGIGYTQLRRHYSCLRPPANVNAADAPHVTIIRPIKGLEPSLYACLASTFLQQYPKDRLHVRFCISSRNHEPSLPVLHRLLADYPNFDAQILVEDEDAELQRNGSKLGPNPKVRNMSRAYREAVGDLIWIVDCNVWVGKGAVGRMVGLLEGTNDESGRRNKFVHQLPLVVDTEGSTLADETQGLLANGHLNDASRAATGHIRTTSTDSRDQTTALPAAERNWSTVGGGRLEEAFMSSSHAKFYTAINTVLIAPCIVGKSTMFRKPHLNHLTHGQGIDYFSQNICEDHLIGDLLWKGRVPEEEGVRGEKLGKHALCFGDLAVQPMANMSVSEYWERRVRWLRVRKFTVTLATLVEPGTESFLCSIYGAFAITCLPWLRESLGLRGTLSEAVVFWFLSVIFWCVVDWTLYLHLHAFKSTQIDEDTPAFARPQRRRSFGEWLLAWLGRETLAFPIWFWAFWGGTRVEWRGRKFWVGMDMKVHELDEKNGQNEAAFNMDRKACFCGATFISLDLLYQHAVDQGHRFMCSCTRLFKTEQNVKNHQRDSGPSHPCPSIIEHPALAGYETAKSAQDEQHQTAAAASQYPCYSCNKVKFKTFKDLQFHIKDKHAICPTCNQTFSTKQHRSNHQKQMGHCYCREHDQQFLSTDGFKAHKRAVTHVKDFICTICNNREFSTQQGLDDHLRDFIHTFSPSQADDAASQAARLRTEQRNRYCLDCGKQFRSLKAFCQHKASPKHNPLSELTCPLSTECKVFTTPSAMFSHMESGGCKSGMNRLKLNAIVHQHDAGNHITYSENKAKVLSQAASIASLEDSVGKLSMGSSRGAGICNGNAIPSDDFDVVSQASDSTLAGGNGVPVYTPSATTSSNSSAGSWKLIKTPSASTTSGSSDTGGVILTPRSSAADSTDEWSFIDKNLATPSSTSAKSSSGETVTQTNSDGGFSCQTCNKKFQTQRQLRDHLNSPVHAAKIFHCPTDLGGQPHARGEKQFKILSGMTQHLEGSACAGGMETLMRVVGIVEEKVKQATGMELRLLKGSPA
ncbi:glycosyltransferase family 21 protein [Hortaea werneckii]|nr:glycosyltransferase family 21 protein [Hortaea werneckii]